MLFPAGANFYFLLKVQTDSETHLAFYPMGTDGSFHKVKRAEPSN
jgi:hypothetical protein